MRRRVYGGLAVSDQVIEVLLHIIHALAEPGKAAGERSPW